MLAPGRYCVGNEKSRKYCNGVIRHELVVYNSYFSTVLVAHRCWVGTALVTFWYHSGTVSASDSYIEAIEESSKGIYWKSRSLQSYSTNTI